MDNDYNSQTLLNDLFDEIANSRLFPLSNGKCLVNRDEILDLIDRIRALLPSEITEAKNLVSTKREYIQNAKREADRIRKSAEERSRQLIDEQEVLRSAKTEARDILAAAHRNSTELRRNATEFVSDMLKHSEETLSESLSKIAQSRVGFNEALKNIEKQIAGTAAVREEAKVLDVANDDE